MAGGQGMWGGQIDLGISQDSKFWPIASDDYARVALQLQRVLFNGLFL